MGGDGGLNSRSTRKGRGDRRSLRRGVQAIWPDAAAGPKSHGPYSKHLPAFGEINRRYEKKVPTARPECTISTRVREGQNGFTTAKITIPTMSSVGTSLISL